MRHLLNGMKNGYNLGKFDHDLAATETWKSWFILGKSSPTGRKIQVSEIL